MRSWKSQARVCQVANVCILAQIAFDFGWHWLGLALPLAFAYLCMPQAGLWPLAACHIQLFLLFCSAFL